MDELTVPQGNFAMQRYPVREKEALRAWDAADEFLLHFLAGDIDSDLTNGQELPELRGKNVVINDGFGALTLGLAEHKPTVVSDLFLSLAGIEANLAANAPDADFELRNTTEPLPFPIDLAILKVPKSLGLLEHQLHQIREVSHAGTAVVAAGMARHIHSSTLELFEKILGPTRTSLARKKARLIFPTLDLESDPGENPWPKEYTEFGTSVTSHAGVFSAEKLDQGTRVLLESLPPIEEAMDVVDLGCGSGIVGTVLASSSLAALTFIDQSHLAVESARTTFETTHPGASATFIVGNCTTALDDESVDIVVANPPFHDDHALAEVTAFEMFVDAKRVLRPGGELRIVGNRHLGYHAKLKRIFGNQENLSSNPKFVVMKSIKEASDTPDPETDDFA